MPLGASAGPVALCPPLVSSLILDCEVLGTSDDLVAGCASSRADVTAGGVSGVTAITWSTPLLLPVPAKPAAGSAADAAAEAAAGGPGAGPSRTKPGSSLQAQALCYAATADGRIAIFKANGRTAAPVTKAAAGPTAAIAAAGGAAASTAGFVPSSLQLHAVISSGEVLRCLAVSHDGTCLATGGNGGKVRLWGTAVLLEKGAEGPPPNYEALSMEDAEERAAAAGGKEKEKDGTSDMLAARRQALKPVSVRLAASAAEAARAGGGHDAAASGSSADAAAASLRDPCQPYWAKFPSGQPVLCATAADCLVATLTVGDDTVVYRSGALAALAGGGEAADAAGDGDADGDGDLDGAFGGLDGLGLSGSRRSARLPSTVGLGVGGRASMAANANGGRPRASMRLSFAAGGAGSAGTLRAVPEGPGAGAGAGGAAAKPASAHDPSAAAASVSDFWGSPSRWVTALCFRRLHARMRTDVGPKAKAKAKADADADVDDDAEAEAEAEAEVDAELSLGQQYLLVAGTKSGEAAMWVGKRHEPEDDDDDDEGDDDGARRRSSHSNSNSFSLSQSRSRTRSHLERRASRGSAAYGGRGTGSRLSEDGDGVGLAEAGEAPAGRRRPVNDDDVDAEAAESNASRDAAADMLAQAGLEDAVASPDVSADGSD